MDILFVKLGALGDVINTLPLAVNLKRHLGARIHWISEPLSAPLLAEHPYVDCMVLFDKYNWTGSLPDVVRQIRRHRYDAVLDLQRIWKSGLLTSCARAERRIGFDSNRCKEMTYALPFERIPPADPQRHMLLQYREFATFLDVQNFDIEWQIPVTGRLPYNLPEAYIVLNIGATKPANLWTAEGFAALARLIGREWNFKSVLTGGPQDMQLAQAITAINPDDTIDLSGRTSVLELKEVLNASRAVVSCDTGPMHLAVALGKKVIALFGPANPSRTGPFYGSVIRKDMDCSPCNRRSCDDPACMYTISAQEVMAELKLQLI